MKNAFLNILKSKRVLMGISGIIIPVIMKAFNISDPATAEQIWITCCILIVGQSASDWGKNKK